MNINSLPDSPNFTERNLGQLIERSLPPPASRAISLGIVKWKMSKGKEEGKNVVHKRLQSRAENPAAKQSQPDTEEIASTSLEGIWFTPEECHRGFRKDSAINGYEEQIATTGKKCRSRNDRLENERLP